MNDMELNLPFNGNVELENRDTLTMQGKFTQMSV